MRRLHNHILKCVMILIFKLKHKEIRQKYLILLTKRNRPPCKHNYRAKPDTTVRIVSGFVVRVPLPLYPSLTVHSFDNIRDVTTVPSLPY